MSNVCAVLARVVVPDLEAALPLYQQLAGNTTPYQDRTATLLVESLTPVLSALQDALAQQVGMAVVAGVLLDHVGQDPAQRELPPAVARCGFWAWPRREPRSYALPAGRG
jgi:hypothetical protein